MFLHHAVDCAQSQACAFADRLGGIERIKYAKRLFDAGAAIGKLDKHFFVLRTSALTRSGTATGFLDSVQSVLDNLNKRLEQLVAISPDFRQVGWQ